MGALALVTDNSADKPTPTPFGAWLKEKRAAKGLSQEQLGKAADCSGAYVSGLERGADKSKPAPAIVDAWARALGYPENEARRIAGHPPILTSQEEADRVILDYYEGASPESQEIMRAVLKTIFEVDQRRIAEGANRQEETPSKEIEAGEWPGSKDSNKDKKDTKRSKR